MHLSAFQKALRRQAIRRDWHAGTVHAKKRRPLARAFIARARLFMQDDKDLLRRRAVALNVRGPKRMGTGSESFEVPVPSPQAKEVPPCRAALGHPLRR